MEQEKERNVLMDIGIPTESTTTKTTAPQQKDGLTEESQGDALTENSQEDGLTDKSQQDSLTEKSHKDGLTDKSQKAALTEKSQQDALTEKTDGLSLNEKEAEKQQEQTQARRSKEKERVRSPSPPPLPPKDDKFLPQQHYADDGQDIATLMDDYDDEMATPELQKIMSPTIDTAFRPPRSSSLDPSPAASAPSPRLQRMQSRDSYIFSPAAARAGSISGVNIAQPERTDSPRPASSIFQPPPPSPDPELALPFDFHRFLEQLRHRTADPVARFLRSFLNEFGKKQWAVHEQVKIISDFLEFISKKMAQCEVWRSVSDAEFDNAREGMEKLVMNRLYSQTFSPTIPPAEASSSPTKKRFRNQPHSPHGPGRRGQHQEDVERDHVISQKIRIYGWIREEHLDIAPITDKGRRFLVMAQQELLKISSYRAPRDKVICILNTCKVIFGYLKNSKGDQSADSFVPLLIYTVLHANPPHLVSNLQYILRFRNQEKLGGEAGYYISSLMGVVSFIENLDRTNLTITDEEFERNVEAAVSQIAEGHKAESYQAETHDKASATATSSSNEKAGSTKPDSDIRNSTEGQKTPLPRIRNSTEGQRTPLPRTGSTRSKASIQDEDDNSNVTNILRTIQKPLSSIGRMFSDDGAAASSSTPPAQSSTPHQISTPLLSPGLPNPPTRKSSEETRQRRSSERQHQSQRARSFEQNRLHVNPAEDAAAKQASAEVAEAQRVRAEEHSAVVETLQGMFPDMDRDIISDVVRMKEGNVGSAVDACLALNN